MEVGFEIPNAWKIQEREMENPQALFDETKTPQEYEGFSNSSMAISAYTHFCRESENELLESFMSLVFMEVGFEVPNAWKIQERDLNDGIACISLMGEWVLRERCIEVRHQIRCNQILEQEIEI